MTRAAACDIVQKKARNGAQARAGRFPMGKKLVFTALIALAVALAMVGAAGADTIF